jgi:hypothetical protein
MFVQLGEQSGVPPVCQLFDVPRAHTNTAGDNILIASSVRETSLPVPSLVDIIQSRTVVSVELSSSASSPTPSCA